MKGGDSEMRKTKSEERNLAQVSLTLVSLPHDRNLAKAVVRKDVATAKVMKVFMLTGVWEGLCSKMKERTEEVGRQEEKRRRERKGGWRLARTRYQAEATGCWAGNQKSAKAWAKTDGFYCPRPFAYDGKTERERRWGRTAEQYD